MFAVVSSGGAAEAATAPSYAANVSSTGLDIGLLGQTLTGGFANACVNSGSSAGIPGSNCAGTGTSAPFADATGEGILLTSMGLDGKATAKANAPGTAAADPTGSVPPTLDSPGGDYNCSPVSSGGPKGSSGVTVNLGLACANAQAAVDDASAPSAAAAGRVAMLTVDLAGILSPILGASPASGSANNCDQQSSNKSSIGALLNGVCQIVNGITGPTGATGGATTSLLQGVEQALQSLTDVVTKDLAQTVDISVGGATAQISQAADGTVTAAGQGSTLDVKLLEGVGCTQGTSLLTCATNEAAALVSGKDSPTGAPLVEVLVAPANCVETRDATTGNWTAKSESSVVDVHVNLPGDPINLEIPGTTGNGGVNQTILGGTPLQSTIEIAAASAAPLGSSSTCSADSVTLNLLTGLTGGVSGLPSLPIPGLPSGGGGPSTTGQGLVYASLGNTSASVTSGTAPASAPAGGQVQTAAASSPTAVHTGEWWSGSLPLLATLAAIGAALIGWPRLRRFTLVNRVIHRSGR